MKTYRILMFQSGRRDDSYGLVNRSTVARIKSLAEKIDSDPKETQIDLWIDSPGGDANAAFKLWHFLQSKCSVLRAVVPGYAKSAATLLSIGCDEIFMADDAELGPLDVQIEHPDREGVRVSGLDVAKALQFLTDHLVMSTISAGQKIYQSTELPRRDVLREVSTFAATFMQPLVAKLDPHLIHKASNELEVAEKYAEQMLSHRRLKRTGGGNESDPDASPECDPWFVSHYLVHHYPAHEFFVSCSAAKELGLPIKPLDDYQDAVLAQHMHSVFEGRLDDDGYCRSMVMILDDGDVKSLIEDEDDEDESDTGQAENPAEPKASGDPPQNENAEE